MTYSMTGFASSSVQIRINNKNVRITLQLKTLNSRFFESTCKMPSLMAMLEVPFQQLLKKELIRGHVYVSARVQYDTSQLQGLPSIQTLIEYKKYLEEVRKECHIEQAVTLDSLLQLESTPFEEDILTPEQDAMIIECLSSVIEQVKKMRAIEGDVLQQDINAQLNSIKQTLEKIAIASAKSFTIKKEQLTTILSQQKELELTPDSTQACILEQKKIQSITELERIDIHEEIIRASAHVQRLQESLRQENSTKGKTLDFTLQELLREVNTIASKCNDYTMSSLTIDLKTMTEQAREQAQNIL